MEWKEFLHLAENEVKEETEFHSMSTDPSQKRSGIFEGFDTRNHGFLWRKWNAVLLAIYPWAQFILRRSNRILKNVVER